jgi:hypothetical protein
MFVLYNGRSAIADGIILKMLCADVLAGMLHGSISVLPMFQNLQHARHRTACSCVTF